MKFAIIDIEEFSGKKAQIYSIMYEGDDMTLMDHFFEDNEKEHQEDLKEIAACINKAIIEKDLKVKDDGTLDISKFIELEI